MSLADDPDMPLCVVRDAAELSRVAARRFARHARAAVAASGRFSVALSGGGTPLAMYRLLAERNPQYEPIPWSAVYFFWSDERHVSPDHADSNFRAASEAMLSRLPIAECQILRIRAEQPDAQAAALEYERTLRDFFAISEDAWPRFDLVLLGLGVDGHTASLFPGTKALDEQRRIVVANRVETLGSERITLTAPAINHAAHVVFLVSGADKAAAVQAVIDGPYHPTRWPAQLIRPEPGRQSWIIDAEAARLLDDSDPGLATD